MNAKEKAEELVDKFKDYANDEYHECSEQYELTENMKKNAKQCAIITVDEIINAIDWHEFETPNKEFEFWNEVRNEIEKI